MQQGTICRLIRDKGFGFIRCVNGDEVFFHRTALDGVAFDQLHEGQAVDVDVEPEANSLKGPRARRVILDANW